MKRILYLGLAITSVALLSSGLARTTAQASDPADQDNSSVKRSQFFPNQKYRPLKGRTIGVVVKGADELLRLEGRKGVPDSVCFSVDGGSYLWMYVPVAKRPIIGGIRIPVGEDGKTIKRFDNLSPANSATIKPWGIDDGFALVEVEVNGGHGSPGGEYFVASSMRRLDGTPEYPLKLSAAVEQLWQQYRTWIQDQQENVKTALREAAEKFHVSPVDVEKLQTNEAVYVTWLTEGRRFRLHYRTRWILGTESPRLSRDETMPKDLKTLPTVSFRPNPSFGVEIGMIYEVSPTGKLLNSLPLPLESYRDPKPGTPGGKQTAANRTTQP